MKSTDILTNYIQHLFYAVSNPRMAEVLSSSVTIDKVMASDVNTKLMGLGALFTSGKLDECIQLADQLDLSDIPDEEASLLVLIIFSKFYEHGTINHQNSDAFKHLLTSICPKALQSHKKYKKPLSPQPLIQLDYSHMVNAHVSGVVFFSEFIFGPGSRKCEVGYRIQKALSSQGWDVSLSTVGDIWDYSDLTQKDFAIIDVFAFYQMPFEDICAIISRLKRFFRKIIMVDTDVWAGRSDDMLRSIEGSIDYIWGFTADWCLVDEPAFKDRSIIFPNFGGFDHLDDIIGRATDWSSCTFNFTGSVQPYNINRISWLLDFCYRNLPVEIKITNPKADDGLDHASSQRLYAMEVASTNAAINLTTRTDGTRIVTGRSIEVISLNRLLIQESCPVFNRYFVEGEHFLEFCDTDELAVTIEFLRSHPQTAQMLCSQGYIFYKEKYSCKKLVQHFQTLL